jgi:hypothetical protein
MFLYPSTRDLMLCVIAIQVTRAQAESVYTWFQRALLLIYEGSPSLELVLAGLPQLLFKFYHWRVGGFVPSFAQAAVGAVAPTPMSQEYLEMVIRRPLLKILACDQANKAYMLTQLQLIMPVAWPQV